MATPDKARGAGYGSQRRRDPGGVAGLCSYSHVYGCQTRGVPPGRYNLGVMDKEQLDLERRKVDLEERRLAYLERYLAFEESRERRLVNQLRLAEEKAGVVKESPARIVRPADGGGLPVTQWKKD